MSETIPVQDAPIARRSCLARGAFLAAVMLLTGCGNDQPDDQAEALHTVGVTQSRNPGLSPAASENYWRERLSGPEQVIAVDFIQDGQLVAGNGHEAALAAIPLLIVGQVDSGPGVRRDHLDAIRAMNPDGVMLAHLFTLEDVLASATGPGSDVLRGLQTIEQAYLADDHGNRLYVTDPHGTRAWFDPRVAEVRAAMVEAIDAVLQSYPYAGVFLDDFHISDSMLLDTSGNQYTGAAGQVISETDRASKAEALRSLSRQIRDRWPNALFVVGDDPLTAEEILTAQRAGNWSGRQLAYESLDWADTMARLQLSPETGTTSAQSVTPINVLIHVVPPMDGNRILPDTWPLPGRRTDAIEIAGARGEYESASFVMRSAESTSRRVTLTPGPLMNTSTGDTIPPEALDIRFVKAWFQGINGWNGLGKRSADDFGETLIPELLLKDDSLVRVDEETRRNYLKLQRGSPPEYVWINPPGLAPADLPLPSLADFPVRDEARLQPAVLEPGANKQVWLTVAIPEGAEPGNYVGPIRLHSEGQLVASLTVHLRVHAIDLAAPRLTYSIYYRGKLDPAKATVGSESKTEEQMRHELLDMKRHGITQPTLYQPFRNRERLAQELDLRRRVGLNRGALYYLGIQTTATPAEISFSEASLHETVPLALQMAHSAGYEELYVYGRDEARGADLLKQRKQWQIVQQAGAKVFVAGATGAHDLVGDLLNGFVHSRQPSAAEAERWHAAGQRIYSYANPQVGPENPYLFRLNYGLLLWANDYDGAMTYAYQDCFGSCWNDTDHDTYRDHMIAYPTVDGVIPTLAWEGHREAVDDVRYLTTLEAVLAARPASDMAAIAARNYLTVLRRRLLDQQGTAGPFNQNMALDLDAVRTELVAHLSALGANGPVVPKP